MVKNHCISTFFLVEKPDFGNIKLSLGTKIRFMEIIYANLCEKWPKIALFGPKKGLNVRKPLYFHIVGVKKTDFGNIKLSLGTKIRFLDIIMLIYAENGPKKSFLVPKWLKRVENHCISTFLGRDFFPQKLDIVSLQSFQDDGSTFKPIRKKRWLRSTESKAILREPLSDTQISGRLQVDFCSFLHNKSL